MNILYFVTQNVDWMVVFNITVLIYTFIRLYYYSSLSKLPKRAWISLASVVVFFLIAELTRILSLLYPSSAGVNLLTTGASFCAFIFSAYLILHDIWQKQKDKVLFVVTTFIFIGVLVLALLLSHLYGYYYSQIWILTSCLLIVKTIDVLVNHLKNFDFDNEKKFLVSVFTLYLLFVILSVISFVFPLRTYLEALLTPNVVSGIGALEMMKTLVITVIFFNVLLYKSKREDGIHALGRLTSLSKLFGITLFIVSLFLLLITNFSSANTEKSMKEDIHTKVQIMYDTSGIKNFPAQFKFNPAGYDSLVEEYSGRFQNVLKTTGDFKNIYLLGEQDGKFFYYLLVKDNKVIKSDFVAGDIRYYNGDDTLLRQSVDENIEKLQNPSISSGHTEISLYNPETVELGSIIFGVDLNQTNWSQEIYKSRAIILFVGMIASILVLIGYENVIRSKRNAAKIEVSEMKYRKIFNSASNAIIILKEDERIIANCNSMALHMFVRTKAELKGMKFDSLIARSSSLIFLSFIESFISGSKELKSVKMRKGKGDYFIANFKIMKYRSGNERYIQLIIEDITKEAELLKESQQYISELEKLNKLMIGRELRMIELKKEITSLKEKYEGK